MALHTEATRGAARILTFENPPVNALGFAMVGELLAAIDAAENDAAITTIVFTGSGSFFSAGADINDFLREPPKDAKNIR
ncbi:MAG: enoyl-CoA hydratase/isomerase family protein, partial [Candidatus Eremiobacteraeota bacterium]|nr:enoyl-CoA hydratase/isomerase family protein [Candidatus Eremiobacteraeota bacterium]